MNKLRFRLLQKLAQATPAQPAQPTTTPITVPAPPALPGILSANLATGYNSATIPLLMGLVQKLHEALHYASNGKDNFQKIIDNNLDLSGAIPDVKNVGGIAKKVYITFFNGRNPFTSKVAANIIRNWGDSIINSPEYSNLSQIKPTSPLSIKLQGNLKPLLLDYINQIKQQNPATP
jgi:hypothetical protein